MPFLSGYSKRKALKYGTAFPGGNLTGFPKLFKAIADAQIASELSGGGGIAVTLADGTTTIPFGIYPSSVPATGDLILRAKLDPLTAASTGDVMGYIYYDHTQTTSQDKANTVSNGYAAFMPLEEDPSGSAPQMRDWVTNTLIGTSHGSMTSGDLVTGQVANALDCDSNDYVTCGNLTALANSAALTIEVLAKYTSTSKELCTKHDSSINQSQFEFYTAGGGAPYIFIHTTLDGLNPTYRAASVPTNDGTWRHIAAVFVGGSSLNIYVDGVGKDGALTGSIPATLNTGTSELSIGATSDGTLVLGGLFDELKISSVARSANWLAYTYADEFTNSDTFTLGAEETSASGITFDAASNSGYQAAQSTYTWNHTCTGANLFLSVDVEMLSVPGTIVTSITYNGSALSFIGAKSSISGAGRVECWGIVAPTTGTHAIVVILSASVASAGTAVSRTGVHQTSPTEAFNGAQATNVGAADATVTITSISNNCVIHAACATDDTAITANQTTRNNVTGALGSGADEDTGPVTPAGATAMSYTGVGALATWVIAGYAVRPVADGALVVSRNLFLNQAVMNAANF